MRYVLPVLPVLPVLSLVALAGCSWLDPCADECEGGYTAVQGAPEAFTEGPRSEPGVEISAPARCDPWDDPAATGHAITVRIEGTREAGTFVPDRLIPELQARGISTSGWGLPGCADEGLGVYALDWASADPIVRTAVELASADDVSLLLQVELVPQPIACPDVGCGM